jgi:hypothetical protein
VFGALRLAAHVFGALRLAARVRRASARRFALGRFRRFGSGLISVL